MSGAEVSVASDPPRDRKAAKGRRRRAAAEQRRIEQQRWGHYLEEEDEDDDYAISMMAPIPPGSRRRARRRSDRESLRQHSFEDALEDDLDPDLALSLALALSLSTTTASTADDTTASIVALADMTYESLVQLENVSCVAPPATIASLPVSEFVKEHGSGGSEVCVICQGEYDHGDRQLRLPCLHAFHQACGSEWLHKYSKLCPVCKHDVTEPLPDVPEVSENTSV